MFIIHTYSTASIAEFNQKLQDAKSSKSQPLSEKLTSMVEARYAIRYLTNMVCTPHELPSSKCKGMVLSLISWLGMKYMETVGLVVHTMLVLL